jgi:glycerol-3-phosphate O-acyltransferase
MDQFKKLAEAVQQGKISQQLAATLHEFYLSYAAALSHPSGSAQKNIQTLLNRLLDLVLEQLARPYEFEPYHEQILTPFNYYQFGLDLIRPLIQFEQSKLLGTEHLDQLQLYLNQGDNVILFSNHQTEPDPQAISLMLEKRFPKLAQEMIFMAGHRVTSDPLAVPFSMGRNLLCIYSKKYIETDPATKAQKLLHNQRTMKKMQQLLSAGGKCIYIAPSGGRDRINSEGQLQLAAFDPQSIEMSWLMAKKSGKRTHFFPLSLYTYALLPPPSAVQKKLGEPRYTRCTPIHLAFGAEIDMENFPGIDHVDKKQQRQQRAEYIWSEVVKNYKNLFA